MNFATRSATRWGTWSGVSAAASDVVRDELVETRAAMADRVARIEGRVFGVPLPGTGTDPA
ncbi:hypothetical protein [Candidatus Palauibacter sp.]|uniref:hypothetical protein n=1 Tax=Candidatus Palauibacter sp. TaxID=3101350 RepID=UPI003B51E899